jgi:hypothetical protein
MIWLSQVKRSLGPVHSSWLFLYSWLLTFLWSSLIYFPLLILPMVREEFKNYSLMNQDQHNALSTIASATQENLKSELSEDSTSSSALASVVKRNVLLRMTQDQEFEKIFMDHLVKEFSTENLMFVRHIQRVQEKKPETNELLLETSRINFEYLQDDSPSCINLSDNVRKKAIAAISSVQSQLECCQSEPISDSELMTISEYLLNELTPAVVEILNIMERDSFRRFKLSKEYKEYMQKKEVLKVALNDPVRTSLIEPSTVEK